MAAPAIPPSAPFRLTQPVADAATAAGVVFADGVARLARRERFRRGASLGNPMERTPLVAPPAWVASTAYVPGQAVANGGNWYAATIGGTSASSGGPLTAGTGALVADGGVSWTWIGAAEITVDDPAAPVLTTSTTTPAGLTQLVYPGTSPANFRAYGAAPVPIATTQWAMNVFSQKAGSIVTGKGSAIGIDTEELKFSIPIGTGTGNVVRFIIDGRYYSISGTPQNSVTTWYTFDFTGKGLKKFRNVRVESPLNSFNFLGIATAPGGQVRPPLSGDDIRAVFIGSSLFAGSAYGPYLPGGTEPNRIAKNLGWSDPWNYSTSGTGPIATGASSFYTYGERVAEALTLNPDVWVIDGPINEVITSASPAAVKAAIKAYLTAIRAGSTAPIYQLGIWCIPAAASGGDAAVVAMETASAEAVAEFNDPLGRTFFIPVRNDPVGPWLVGSWNDGGNVQKRNSDKYLAGDAVHPTEIGTPFKASLTARAIRATFPTLS